MLRDWGCVVNLLELDLATDDGPMHGPTTRESDALAAMAEQFVDRIHALLSDRADVAELAGFIVASNGRDVFVGNRDFREGVEGISFHQIDAEEDLSGMLPGFLPVFRGPAFAPFPAALRSTKMHNRRTLLPRARFVSQMMAVASVEWSPQPEPKDIRSTLVVKFGGAW